MSNDATDAGASDSGEGDSRPLPDDDATEEDVDWQPCVSEEYESSALTCTLSFRAFFFAFLAGGGLEHEEAEEE